MSSQSVLMHASPPWPLKSWVGLRNGWLSTVVASRRALKQRLSQISTLRGADKIRTLGAEHIHRAGTSDVACEREEKKVASGLRWRARGSSG